MSVLTFRGGIHPFDGKSLSKEKPIQKILPVRDLVYPLSQHIGAPAAPVVKKGDHVLAGQVIAEAGGFVSAPIYASVSGTVKSIEPRLTPGGAKVNSIVLENDGEYQETEYETLKPFEQLSTDEIISAIQKAGVVGMGGAGFPTHVKLSPKDRNQIDYVIANCAECEPYLTSDYRRMLEEPEKLIEGMRIILSLFPNAIGVLAVEDNKVDCALKLEKLLKGEKRNISVKTLKTKYPQGSERHLIYAVTGRQINSSQLPADAGCIVDNVDTICSIRQAVVEGKPLTSRIVTVTGDAIKEPCNFEVLLGTSHLDLIEAAGGLVGEPQKIISGGPMMGNPLFELDVPVVKTSSAILCMSEDEAALEPQACINCGRCAEVCPGQIIPARLARFAAQGNQEEFLKWNGMECCECGCCSYICPAKRHLTQSIKTMRRQILAQRKKK